MIEVVSVKFNCHGKAYYFDPNGIDVRTGNTVIVETAKGLDIGVVAAGPHYVLDESVVMPLRPIVRLATEDDLRIDEQNRQREKEAFAICKQKIKDHGLDMKLVDVECGFEGNKILFFFTADGRVDFRDLVKDLASVFRMRIELRQIGVRDETKMLGGLGICGRPYCCSQFLDEFQPVSTKMAKTQSMSLNPTKISGSCGRLMCCLRYEEEAYEDLLKTIPKNGAFVQTPDGYGNVISTNVLRQKVKVRIDEDGEDEFRVYDAMEIAVVPGGRPKPGEPLPKMDLPKISVHAEEPEPEEDDWNAPNLFAEEMGTAEHEMKPEQDEKTVHDQNPRPRNRQRGQKQRQNQGGKPLLKPGAPSQGPKQQNQQHPVQPPKPRLNGANAAPQGEAKPKPNNRNHRRPRPKKGGEGNQDQQPKPPAPKNE